jgi:hypothetical protein
MGHGASGIGHRASAKQGIGHTSPRDRTAIDTRIFKEVWDLDLLFFL